jgi:hypothetical protein
VELPLNGRDWASLAVLEPGVVAVRVHEQVTQPGGNLRGLGNQMTIDGNRPTQNVYRLNGVVVNDYSNAGPGNVLGASLGVDAIQEFSVLTANYSAEYGFTSGGVINAITKSGTNQFHGSAYEFFRNKVFDSNTYLTPDAKPPFVRNQFGGSGGGPIIKNKLFVFADYEGIRQRKGIPVTAKILTPNARLGILNDSNGNPLPALVGPCLKVDGTTPNPNATNLAPGQASQCVDTFVEKYYNALTPSNCNNGLIGPSNNTCNFVTAGDQAVNDDYGTARVDYKISDKDSIDASFYRDFSNWAKPANFDFETTGYVLPNMSAALEENHIFSPSMVNSVRFGWTQSIVKNPGLSVSNPALVDTSLGMTTAYNAPGLSGQGGGGAGVNGITGPGGFSAQGGFSDWVQNYQIFDDVSRTIGKHTLKFGVEFIRNHTDLVNGNGNGSAGFGSISRFLSNEPFTVRMPTSPPWTAGNTKHYNRNSVFGAYVQDDWKMRPNLTVNVGLRYEMSTIPFEKNGKFILLPALWTDPGNCSEDINGLPQSNCSGLAHSVFDSNPTLRNFEPRVGFAWDPFKSGKTSVRGGFGIFDVLPMPFMFGLNALQASPSGAELDLTNTNAALTCVTQSATCPLPQGVFAQGFPAAVISSGQTAAGTGRWQYTDRNPKRNYVMQWNLNVQRQITGSQSLTLAYAGSRGLHNPFQTDTLNTCFPTDSPAGWLFPAAGCPVPPPCPLANPPTGIVANTLVNPCVPGLLLSTAFFSESTYHSFQANYAKKISHGLQAEVSFTWQKSFDNSSGSFAGDNYSSNPTAATPWWDGRITRGLSDFNVTRNLSINWLYQIPTPKAFAGPAGILARGWSVGGLLTLSDGVPMWPLSGLNSDPLLQANSEPMDIPDLAPGCTAKNVVQSGNLQYLKPSCFIYPIAPSQTFWNTNCNQTPNLGKNPDKTPITLAQAGLDPLTCTNLLGHLGRNAIIGPGLFNVDMSVIKDTHISKFGENFNVQFRAEFFNIFNRANYQGPTDNLVALDPLISDNPSFGQIDQDTQVPMREIQFALKIVF